jgi:hypothetical protein
MQRWPESKVNIDEQGQSLNNGAAFSLKIGK